MQLWADVPPHHVCTWYANVEYCESWFKWVKSLNSYAKKHMLNINKPRWTEAAICRSERRFEHGFSDHLSVKWQYELKYQPHPPPTSSYHRPRTFAERLFVTNSIGSLDPISPRRTYSHHSVFRQSGNNRWLGWVAASIGSRDQSR